MCKTFLDARVPINHGCVKGYSLWVRKDRSTQSGDEAFCYKEHVNAVPVPGELGLLALKINICTCYYQHSGVVPWTKARPQSSWISKGH